MRVSELIIYPIKSTAPLSHTSTEVENKGLRFDRNWALFDENKQLITGRTHPQLLDLQSRFLPQQLRIQQANGNSIHIPLEYPETTVEEFGFFSRSVPGISHRQEINDWFSDYLGFQCQLVFMNDSVQRFVLAKHGGKAGDLLNYADQAPLLLVSTASVDDLNQRLEHPVSIANFRPNVVMEGSPAFEEHRWKRIQIGEVVFDVNQACKRCIFINIDPITKQKGKEPLKTLATYRKDEEGDVIFGVHLIPRTYGKIHVDDSITVLK